VGRRFSFAIEESMKTAATVFAALVCGFVLPTVGFLKAQVVEPGQSFGAKDSDRGYLATRPLKPTDPFSIRTYDEKRVSPDGQMAALEIREWAPGASAPVGDFLNINQRTELWVAYRNGQKRQRVTPEQPVQLSQWDPVWSPNGQQLAFLSNEGQANAFLEVWDRNTAHVRRLTKVGVDLNADISQTLSRENRNHMLWLDETHLLIVLLPAGSHSFLFDSGSGNELIASAGIRVAEEGAKATAIVASSPPHTSNTDDFPQAKLTIIDTKTGDSRALGDVPVWISSRRIIVSSNNEWAAVVATIPRGPINSESEISPRQFQWTKLGLASLAKHETRIRWVNGLQADQVDPTIRWGMGDDSFAIVGRQPGNANSAYLAVVDVPSAEWRSIGVLDGHHLDADEGVGIQEIAWLRDGRTAVKADHKKTTPDGPDYAWWSVSGESATRLTKEEEASLQDDNSHSTIDLIKFETSKTGRLYEKDAAGRETTIFPDLNPQLREIEDPRSMNFEYKSAIGETLHANVLLPHSYVQGKRYPTVVWVYGGDVHSGDGKQPRIDDEDWFLDLLLLAGHGYAVLEPSMPLPPDVRGDPMLHLSDGVDPAVNRAIELGIVDPDRIVLMGHSYGGYSVLGLLTETHRYRAAIALMGVYDLAAMYGESGGAGGHNIAPELSAYNGPSFAEEGQLRMGVPPWVDPERYVRNSPFFAADKISAPLLIVTGDLDGLSLQSEAMFTALHRLGKQVEYVRYLGEGHELESPANILDMWQRVFSWLDTYVKP
jgi:dipeptidyl aminopeptidase/acylaminoacyl peptidase